MFPLMLQLNELGAWLGNEEYVDDIVVQNILLFGGETRFLVLSIKKAMSGVPHTVGLFFFCKMKSVLYKEILIFKSTYFSVAANASRMIDLNYFTYKWLLMGSVECQKTVKSTNK